MSVSFASAMRRVGLLLLLCLVPLRASADEPLEAVPSNALDASSPSASSGSDATVAAASPSSGRHGPSSLDAVPHHSRRYRGFRAMRAIGIIAVAGGTLSLVALALNSMGGHGSSTGSTGEIFVGAGVIQLALVAPVFITVGAVGMRRARSDVPQGAAVASPSWGGTLRLVAAGSDLVVAPTLTLRF